MVPLVVQTKIPFICATKSRFAVGVAFAVTMSADAVIDPLNIEAVPSPATGIEAVNAKVPTALVSAAVNARPVDVAVDLYKIIVSILYLFPATTENAKSPILVNVTFDEFVSCVA